MRKSLKMKVGAVGTTFAMAGALAVIASGTTGAYFNDTATGGIKGTIGSVTLTAESPTSIAWSGLMPGEQKSATVDFQNTGTGPQDFYIVFNNRPALHALNQLGTYGEVHVTGGATGAIVPLFDSWNLQDGRHATPEHPGLDSGYNSCGSVFVRTNIPKDGCWPLPTSLKIAGNVGATGRGTVSFAFNYASKMAAGANGSTGGGLFNLYPLRSVLDSNDSADLAGSDSNGLPFQIVAQQVGAPTP